MGIHSDQEEDLGQHSDLGGSSQGHMPELGEDMLSQTPFRRNSFDDNSQSHEEEPGDPHSAQMLNQDLGKLASSKNSHALKLDDANQNRRDAKIVSRSKKKQSKPGLTNNLPMKLLGRIRKLKQNQQIFKELGFSPRDCQQTFNSITKIFGQNKANMPLFNKLFSQARFRLLFARIFVDRTLKRELLQVRAKKPQYSQLRYIRKYQKLFLRCASQPALRRKIFNQNKIEDPTQEVLCLRDMQIS